MFPVNVITTVFSRLVLTRQPAHSHTHTCNHMQESPPTPTSPKTIFPLSDNTDFLYSTVSVPVSLISSWRQQKAEATSITAL